MVCGRGPIPCAPIKQERRCNRENDSLYYKKVDTIGARYGANPFGPGCGIIRRKESSLATVTYSGKVYEIDDQGFLIDFHAWDNDFARGTAAAIGIAGDLAPAHWDVLNYIRDSYVKTGICPLVFQTCRAVGMRTREFRDIFPSGYLRGACRLAGITYKEGYVGIVPYPGTSVSIAKPAGEKMYQIDVRGFLIDAKTWDEEFAAARAHDMKMPEGLTERHWQIIKYLRQAYVDKGDVPTVFDTCETNGLELSDLEHLFPDGYHRGAVKIAGLRVR